MGPFIRAAFVVVALPLFAISFMMVPGCKKEKTPLVVEPPPTPTLERDGGIELRYRVEWEKAVAEHTRKTAERVVENFVRVLAERDQRDPDTLSRDQESAYASRITVVGRGHDTVVVSFADPGEAALFTPALFEASAPTSERIHEDGEILLRLRTRRVEEMRQQILDKTVDTMDKRLTAFGVFGGNVRRDGEADIIAGIPGVGGADAEMLRKVLGSAGQLRFRMVDDSVDETLLYASQIKAYAASDAPRMVPGNRTLAIANDRLNPTKRTYFIADDKSELTEFFDYLARNGALPYDHVFGVEQASGKDDAGTPDEYYRAMYLFAKVEISGEAVSRAQVMYRQEGTPYVSIEFDASGTQTFARVTRRHVAERMAIMIDDEVTSAPVINEEITGGRAMISMGGGRDPREVMNDAKSLVTSLNHGAHEASVKLLEAVEIQPASLDGR